MVKIGEGVLSADVLDVPELHNRRDTAISIFQDGIRLFPEDRLAELETECPSVLHAIEYAEFGEIRYIDGRSGNDNRVRDLILTEPVFSVELCLSFLHYLGTSAMYRTFEESTVLTDAVQESSVQELKHAMLDVRANLRARVYDATLHRFGNAKDGAKYIYVKHLASQALGCILDTDQKLISDAMINSCLSGLLAEQKAFFALYSAGFNTRFANNDEESQQVDIFVEGIPLQIKGTFLEADKETRFVTKDRDIPKVIVSTHASFPRFILGKGAVALSKLVNSRASVYN